MRALALATFALLVASCPGPGGGGEVPLSSAKAITAFSFASPPATGAIVENAETIAATVPHGMDVTALVATFTTTGSSVKVGSMGQVSGATANNFTNPVIYTVTADSWFYSTADAIGRLYWTQSNHNYGTQSQLMANARKFGGVK